MITTVIFDMDGVLIDSEHLWRQAEKEVFTSLGATWSEEIANETAGKTTTAVTELWYNLFPWEGTTIAEAEQAVIDRVSFLIHTEGVSKEYVHETLTYLKAQGYKIGLATNSPRTLLDTVVETLGIRSYFDTLVAVEDVLEGKPAPDIYLMAAKNLNSTPSACLVIEDSFTGATAGKKAGMTIVLTPDPLHYDHPKFDFVDFKLHNLLEFQDIVVPFLEHTERSNSKTF